MKNKVMVVSLNLVAVILFAFAALILYWAIYPVSVITHYTLENGEFIEQTEQPYSFTTNQNTVKRGEDISFNFYFQKHYNISGETIRELFCGDNLITLTPFQSNLAVSDKIETVTGRVEIPNKSSTGECYLQYTTIRQLNPIRTYSEIFQSNIFVIE